MARYPKEAAYSFFDYGLHMESRTIYIGSVHVDGEGESGTDASMAERAIKSLFLLDQIPDKPITIIMNNFGGDWYHGMAIYDAISSCQNYVTMKIFGVAMSMGSIILQAADERILAPNARVMIHHGHMGANDHVKAFNSWAQESKRTTKVMMGIYMTKILEKHPDFKFKKLDEMLNFDTILSAEEAVALGLADKVL